MLSRVLCSRRQKPPSGRLFYSRRFPLQSCLKPGSHLSLFAKNLRDRIFVANIGEKQLMWFTLASIRQKKVKNCKKLFSPFFSLTQIPPLSREHEIVLPNTENTRYCSFTLITFAIHSRLFLANNDKCKHGLRLLYLKLGLHLSSFTKNRRERIFAANIDAEQLTRFALVSIRRENV